MTKKKEMILAHPLKGPLPFPEMLSVIQDDNGGFISSTNPLELIEDNATEPQEVAIYTFAGVRRLKKSYIIEPAPRKPLTKRDKVLQEKYL